MEEKRRTIIIIAMKYLVFSDLHGSMRGLRYLQDAVKREKPDLLLCLGDILYGAGDQDATKCAKGLKEIGVPILAVRGNCDYREDENLLGFELPDMRSLSRGMHEIHLNHRPINLSLPAGDFLIHGHTHYKYVYKEGGVTRMNPGSIALPRDDCPSYAIMDESVIELVNALNGKRIQTFEL